MADTIRRVYEIDAKLSTDALAALKAIQANLKAVEDQAVKTKKASKDLGDSASESSHGFDQLNLSSVSFRRELLVLTHELSQGNIKRFGGSLLVLAEQMNATSLIFSVAGAAALGFAAAVGFVAVNIVKGIAEQNAFNQAIKLTGDYAGQTASSINEISKASAASTGATIGQAREVTQALLASGKVGPALFEPTTQAILAFSRASGESEEEVTKDFLKMGDGVQKWADEHNKQYHFITLAQSDYIRQLEETGQTEKAQQVVLQALTDHIGGDHVKNLGYAARAWDGLKNAISGTVDAIKSIGKDTDIATQIATIQGNIRNAQQNKANPHLSAYQQSISGGADAANQRSDAYIEQQQQQLQALNQTLLRQTSNAADKAFAAFVEEEGIKGSAIVRSIQKQIRDGSKVQEVLDEYRAGLAKERATGKTDAQIFPQGSGTSQAQDEALIRKHFGSRDSAATETAVQARIRALGEEDAALKDQINQYELLGKSVDKSSRAKNDFDLSSPASKLHGASPGDAQKIRDLADKVDADQAKVRTDQAIANSDKRIAALQQEANAQAVNTREQKVAVETAKLVADGLQPGTDAYVKQAAKIKEVVNAIQDNILARKLQAQVQATVEEATKLDTETSMLTLNANERKKATEILKIYAQARKDIIANPTAETDILANAAQQVDILTQALDRNYAATRAFQTGASEAFQKYNDDITNSAKFSQDIISGGLNALQTDFEGLLTTGKLSLTNLFTFMKTEFIKQAAGVTVNKIFGDKGIQGFVSDGIQGLGNLLGFNLGSVGASTGAQTAQQLQTQQIVQSTTGLTAMNAATQTSSSALFDFISATVDATSALIRLASTGSASTPDVGSFTSLFGRGQYQGGATGTGDGFTTNAFAGFANGGVMSPWGSLPLNAYAGGGVATGPQMAVFGEGRQNEAYIPLPDNRTVPVTLSGGSGGGGTIVNVYNNGSGDTVRKEQKQNANGQQQIDVYIEKKVRAVFSKDIASGGGMSKQIEGQYGLSRANGAPK